MSNRNNRLSGVTEDGEIASAKRGRLCSAHIHRQLVVGGIKHNPRLLLVGDDDSRTSLSLKFEALVGVHTGS